MDDFNYAGVFLDDCTATVAPMTLPLQFREAGRKAQHHGFGNERRATAFSATAPAGVACPKYRRETAPSEQEFDPHNSVCCA